MIRAAIKLTTDELRAALGLPDHADIDCVKFDLERSTVTITMQGIGTDYVPGELVWFYELHQLRVNPLDVMANGSLAGGPDAETQMPYLPEP